MHFLTSRSLLGLFLLSSKKVAGTPTPSPMLLSQNKFAQQSSTYYEPNHPTTYASNAVDGDTNTFSHTKLEWNPWFEVDLGAMYAITSITVLNRIDRCCINRFRNATFLLHDNNSNEVATKETYGGEIGDSKTIEFGTSFLIVLVHLFLLL